MKFKLRLSEARGFADEGWLKSYHTFSFASYRSNEHMQFGPLRVLNEDQVAPKNGFPTHPHRNYEIFSYILAGELTHTDSMGSHEVCRKGSVQFTSAGKGIQHSEYNRSKGAQCKFLQVWVVPRNMNTTPSYQIAEFTKEQKLNQLCPMIVPKEVAQEKLITVDQDFFAFSSMLEKGHSVTHPLHPKRQVYIHLPITSPDVSLILKNNQETIELKAGDGCYINSTSSSKDEDLIIEGNSEALSEFVLFDMIQYD